MKKKDICFKEMGILLKDKNMCETRIKDPKLKQECLEGVDYKNDKLQKN
jgi:hypothetical protein